MFEPYIYVSRIALQHILKILLNGVFRNTERDLPGLTAKKSQIPWIGSNGTGLNWIFLAKGALGLGKLYDVSWASLKTNQMFSSSGLS